MVLIGISGKKHSGKDESYLAIKTFFEQGTSIPVYRLAFADALKQEVAKGCGVTVDYLEQNKDMFRLILQGWGTDYRRKQDINYWLNKYKEKFLSFPLRSVVVTPDVRFLNEFELIRRVGGKLWRVVREFPAVDSDLHASETNLDSIKFSEWDYSIGNTGSKEELHAAIHHHLQTNITKYIK